MNTFLLLSNSNIRYFRHEAKNTDFYACFPQCTFPGFIDQLLDLENCGGYLLFADKESEIW